MYIKNVTDYVLYILCHILDDCEVVYRLLFSLRKNNDDLAVSKQPGEICPFSAYSETSRYCQANPSSRRLDYIQKGQRCSVRAVFHTQDFVVHVVLCFCLFLVKAIVSTQEFFRKNFF